MTFFTPYNITYLLSQILGVFAIYKLMRSFFEETAVKKSVEAAVYVLYYLLTTSVYLVLNIPLVNFIVNVSAICALAFLYVSSVKKKIFVGLLIYVFNICAEMLIVTVTGYIQFPITQTNNYDSIFGAVAANVLIFIVSTATNSFKSIKKGSVLPQVYWVALFAIPVTSLYVLAMIFQSDTLSKQEVSSSVAAILIVNFMVFFLFDRISLLYIAKQESALIKQQNEYYANQLLIVEDLHTATNKLRHDIKNHLLTIMTYLESNDTDDAKKHISDIIGAYQNNSEIIHTGNPAIDGLLNFKFHKAVEQGIKIDTKISLPSDFDFSPYDLTVILGNLVDNALYAVSSVETNKFIDLRMSCSKGMLIIKISNPYTTTIIRKDGQIVTSKSDKENHGMGLKNVNEVLEKYNGTSDIDDDNGIFTITAALYLPD